jgi:phage-related baseplate assembly protein
MTGVNLALLPPLTVVPQPDFETIVAEVAAKAGLENASPSDPAFRVALAAAYRETLVRQYANEQAKALTLAHAYGAQLDHLGVTYYRNPDNTPVLRLEGESDDDYKARLQESPEGLSVAGPEGAYKFHARSASPLVAGVSVESPNPCEILLTVLSKEGPPEEEGPEPYEGPIDGAASPELLARVATHLSPFRPLGDRLTVVSAEVVYYQIAATIYPDGELDPEMVIAAAQARAEAFVALMWRLAGLVVLSAVDAALTTAGVEEVVLQGWEDVRCSKRQVPVCNGITLTLGVRE